jgi:hypothetical protein
MVILIIIRLFGYLMLAYHCLIRHMVIFQTKNVLKNFCSPKFLVENLIKNLKLEDLFSSLYEED